MMALRALTTPRRLLAALLVTVAAAGGVVTVDATTATATTAATQASTGLVRLSPAMAKSSYESRVLYWINLRRAQHRLPTLRLASCADQVAEKWGDYLATTDQFFHQSMTAILYKCNAYYAGETLGRGAISPKRLVYLWMHSPEHRHILLSPHPRRIGIGAYPDRYGEWVVAADFLRF